MSKTKGTWPADTPRDICTVTVWPSNGEMMYDLYRIGYLNPRRKVVDMTYGKGVWWNYLEEQMGKPLARLVKHDIALDGVDFRVGLPEKTGSVGTVLFDPPYVSTGGRDTSTLHEFNERYGVLYSERTPELNQERLINPGIAEAARIVIPDGESKVLVKCANYVSSKKYKQGVRWSIEFAESVGLTLHDQWIHAGHVRAQPKGRGIDHARNNYSVLLVFTKKRPSRKRKP